MEITMKQFQQLLDKSKVISKTTGDWSAMNDLFYDMLEHFYEYHPEEFTHMYLKYHTKVYGYSFDEDLALLATSHMENKDGTMGAHWGLDVVRQVISTKKIDVKTHFNEFDFYYTLNMMYSDYYDKNFDGDEVEFCVRQALNFLNDIDASDGKAFRYFYKVVLWNPEH